MANTQETVPSAEERLKLQEENRENAQKRLEARRERGLVSTSDTGDASVGWTAQQGVMPEDPAAGQQRYAPWQLPDPEVARAAGVPPQGMPENLVLADDDIGVDPNGPEPTEVLVRDTREQLRERLREARAEAENTDGQGQVRDVSEVVADEESGAVQRTLPSGEEGNTSSRKTRRSSSS